MGRILVLTILMFAGVCAFAQYGRLDFSLQSAQGQDIAGATINVYTQSACGTAYSGAATLYPTATGGTPLTQPLHTDGFGHAYAYAAPGCVTVVYNSPYTGTSTYVDRNVSLGGSGGGSMVYPPAGLGASTGAAWRTPTFSDVVTLWTSCTSGYLKFDGTCSTSSASGVSSLNSLTGGLNITGGAGISITPSGSTIQVTNTGSGAPAVYLNALSYGANPDFLPSGHSSFAYFNLTSGSQTVTVASLTGFSYSFSSGDVGKYITFNNNGSAWGTTPFTTGAPYVAQITAVTNATTFTISTLGANINTLASVFGGWGTDSTPAANACSAAAEAIGGATCAFPPVAGVGSSYFFATQGVDTYGNPMYVFPNTYDDGAYGTPAGGSGATFTCTVAGGHIGTCTITNAGDGLYKKSATFNAGLSGGGCSYWRYYACGWGQVTATTDSAGHFVAAPTVVNQGFGLTGGTVAGTVSGIGGDGATATVTESSGTTGTPTLGVGGDGYGNAASLHYYLLNSGGSGCTTLATQGGTPYVGRGTATANSSGSVTSFTVAANATGCSSAPIVAFGDYVCNTGTYAIPGWGQCSNKAPLLNPVLPVHVMLQPGVNIWVPSGASFGVTFNDAWDHTTINSNQPIMFAGQFQNEDFTAGTVGGFIGLMTTNNANYGRIHDTNFDSELGLYTAATDVGFTASNLSFGGDAPWINGGGWTHRTDDPRGNGGFFDAAEIDNIISRVNPYGGSGSSQQRLDDWFNSIAWHCEFSSLSIDFAETAKCPITIAQRQTSHTLDPTQSGVQGNMGTYRGVSSLGMAIYARDNRNTGQGTFNGLTLKNGSRYTFVGDNGSLHATNWSNESTVPITGTSDPYRAATTQEGEIVDTAGCEQPHYDGLYNQTNTNIGQILYSNNCMAVPAGAPYNAIWNMISNAQGKVNVGLPNQNLNLTANQYFYAGATLGVNNSVPATLTFQGYVSPSTYNNVQLKSNMGVSTIPDLGVWGWDSVDSTYGHLIADFGWYSGAAFLNVNGKVQGTSILDTGLTSQACLGTDSGGTLITGTCSLPLTTVGDTLYENATPAPARLAGPTVGSVLYNLTETPSGGVAQAPVWSLPGIPGRTVTGATDTIAATDRSNTILYNSASAAAVTLTSAATLGSNFAFRMMNENAGTVTFTPGAGTINGAGTFAVSEGMNCTINSPDNTNYLASCSSGLIAAGSNIKLTPTAFGVTIAASGASGTVTSASGTVTTAHKFGTAFGTTPVCTAAAYSNAGAWYFSTLPSTTSSGVITYATSGAQTFSVQCTGTGGIW